MGFQTSTGLRCREQRWVISEIIALIRFDVLKHFPSSLNSVSSSETVKKKVHSSFVSIGRSQTNSRWYTFCTGVWGCYTKFDILQILIGSLSASIRQILINYRHYECIFCHTSLYHICYLQAHVKENYKNWDYAFFCLTSWVGMF